jgi:hypothetical protein
MSRRERRHGNDPVEEAQEEANWSGFTRHIRATEQGKWLFGRPRERLTSGGTRPSTVILVLLVGALAIVGALTLISWILGALF